MGRTGKLTPVAILEPVHIGGVEVTHVSLHNQDEVERKDIRIGDHVLVERAGDVIPHVVRVVAEKRSGHEKRYSLPDEYPSCGSEVSRPEGERLEGMTLVITGSLDAMTRDEAEDAVRREGGRTTSSVSGNTDYLVVGEEPGERKREEADEHGTETLDEDGFLELLGRK